MRIYREIQPKAKHSTQCYFYSFYDFQNSVPSSLGVWKKWHLLFVCFLVSLQGLQKLQNSILSLRANPPIKVKWPFEIFWTSVCLLIRVCSTSSESAILISWKKVSQIQKIGSKLWFMKRRIYLNNHINNF